MLAIINGTFDTSALVYSLVTLLPSSVTLNSVFWVFSVITVVLLVATAVIMPDHPFAPSTPLPSSSPSHSHADGASMKQVLPAAVPSPALVGAPKTTVDTVSCLEEGSAQPNLVPAPHGSIETAGDGPLETAPVAVDDDQAKPQAGEEDLGSQSPGHASPLQLLSIGQQVTTSKCVGSAFSVSPPLTLLWCAASSRPTPQVHLGTRVVLFPAAAVLLHLGLHAEPA